MRRSALPSPEAAARTRLLTVSESAKLLNVSEKTIRRWISDDKVPYLKLPSGGLRIPQGALLASLEGTYDLAAELAEIDARYGHLSEQDVRAAMDLPEP